jgi:hypothetical protein
MSLRTIHLILISLLALCACSREPTPPPVDLAGTLAMQLASEMLTQTVAAYSPTPPPATATAVPTETPTVEPTKDASIKTVTVVVHTGCYIGPGESYTLTSYINVPKKVELLGIGSVPGWYVIKNPYFNSPCWVAAEAVELDPNMDLSVFPTITP